MAETFDQISSCRRLAVATMALLIVTAVDVARTPATEQSNELKIVVLEGEGGVNIVRQKTAGT